VLNPNTLRPFRRKLILANVAILALLLLTVVLVLRTSHKAYAERGQHAAENLVRTLSVGVASKIEQVDNALMSTALQLDRLEESGRPLDIALGSRIAQEQKTLVPHADAIRFTDASGVVLNGGTAIAVSVADRDYFRQARAQPDKLCISDPIQGRITRKWGVLLARARVGKDGGFKGVTYSNLGSDKFVELFDDFALGPQGAVTLRSADSLKLIARFTPGDKDPDASLGSANVAAELKVALAANAYGGSFVGRTALDGVERITAYQRVPGLPMLLLVGLGTDDFYVPWRQQVMEVGSLATVLGGLVVGLSVMFYKRQAIQLQARHEIAKLAGERAAMLENGLVGMVKVKHRVSLWHNQALSDLFGYGPDELLGTPTRLLYPDDASHERVGQGYAQFTGGGQFRTQLQMLRKDGRLIWIDLSGAALHNGESLWLMVDITAVKDSEALAQRLALHDPLTGLPNRLHLVQALEHALRDAERTGRQLAVCYLDLDGFKAVNDQHGHEAGDAVLREAARRMSHCVRGNDLVARMGGDEFVIMLSDLHDAAQLDTVLGRLLESLRQPMDLGNGLQGRVGASIGVALYPDHGNKAEGLLRLADQAMYGVKRGGKGRFGVWKASS
jgi:diguanylate cyclase (GGDEF)-like protein/PAS domain S-box-containing protein